MIVSITGHDTAEMVAHYTEQKREAQLAIGTLNAATAEGMERNSISTAKPRLEK